MFWRALRKHVADVVGGLASILLGIPLVGPALKWVSTTLIWDTAILPERVRRLLIPNPYLNEDPAFALKTYWAEPPAAPNLPFKEVFDWSGPLAQGQPGNVAIRVSDELFALGSWGSSGGDEIREQAFKDWRGSGHGRFSRDTIRVSAADADAAGRCILHVQKATYYDQAKSNLVLDYQGAVGGSRKSLRSILSTERPGRLPDLGDARLANTLGAAALLVYSRDGLKLPLVVARTHDVSVYRGGWHCTVSTATGWPRDMKPTGDLQTFVADRLIEQLYREVGIEKEAIVWLEPVAFCRELMRGGKPQIFYLGEINLDWDGIIFCIKKARAERSDLLDPIEVHNMPMFRKPHAFDGASELLKDYRRKGYTSECAANLYYYFRWRSASDAIGSGTPR
jgi:hypothetical protein